MKKITLRNNTNEWTNSVLTARNIMDIFRGYLQRNKCVRNSFILLIYL